jgi:predicted nucleic acid-binding protein
MSYLVDTDLLIDVAKKNQDAIDYFDALKEGWSISVITAMELIVGAGNKREVA